jgi:hypothetical protein
LRGIRERDTRVYRYAGDGGPAIAAQIGEVVAIAVDNAGNLFLDDLFNAIRKVSASGIISTIVTLNGSDRRLGGSCGSSVCSRRLQSGYPFVNATAGVSATPYCDGR